MHLFKYCVACIYDASNLCGFCGVDEINTPQKSFIAFTVLITSDLLFVNCSTSIINTNNFTNKYDKTTESIGIKCL